MAANARYDAAVEGLAAELSWTGLAWSGVLVAIVLGLSVWLRLGLHGRLLIGCLRTVVQLLAIGYILGYVFDTQSWWVIALAVTVQLAIAVWTAGSLQERPLPGAWLIALLSLAPSYMLVMLILLALVIRPQPWWEPRIILPLGGMLLGNALSGVALALNRYRGELRSNRELVMVRLALAANWRTAVAEEVRSAAHAALLPVVSSLMTVGLVALPGMMTGQIIAGADVMTAVRYQIVVMFMITTVVALAVIISLQLMLRRQRFEAEPAGKARRKGAATPS